MTPAEAMKAYQYVRRYGKKWTKDQVGRFFIAVAALCASVPHKETDA